MAVFESGFSNDGKMAAVQYLKFPVSAGMKAALGDPAVSVRMVADNRRYRAACDLSIVTRNAVRLDLDTQA